MKRILISILGSIWLWSAIFTFFIAVFLYPFFSKYTVDLIQKETVFANTIQFIDDLNSDGAYEKVSLSERSNVPIIFIESGDYSNQQNFDYNFLASFYNCDDYNNNGLKEIYTLHQSNDSVFLNIMEFRDSMEYVTKYKFISTIAENYLGEYDAGSNGSNFLYDFDNDGFKEYVFHIIGEYSYQPRKVYIYNIKKNTITSSEISGVFPATLAHFDFDQDGIQEIYHGSISTGNCLTSDTAVAYPDTSCWLTVYDKELNYKFEPIEFQGKGKRLYIQPYITNDSVYIFAFLGKYSKACDNELFLFDPNGKLIRKRILEYDRWGPLSTKGSIAHDFSKIILYNDEGTIIHFNKNLNIYETHHKLELDKHPGFYSVKADLDGDGTYEYIYREEDGILITKEEFSHPIRLKLENPGARGVQIFQESGNTYAYLRAEQGTYYTIQYQFNKWYRFQHPLYLGIFLVLLLFFYGMKQLWIRKLKRDNIRLNEIVESRTAELQAQTEELQASNEKINDLEKFRKQLTNMIAHDLKQPLSSIIVNAHNDQVKHASHKMLTLINNMLDINKYDETILKLNIGPHIFKELFKVAYDQVKHQFENKQIEFSYNLDNTYVDCDHEIIDRVLINFLTNASKYTPPAGSVKVSSLLENNFLKVEIQDSGEGIEPGTEDHIFERYFQVKPIETKSMHSTGLGLTFNKLAIESHGGEIGAYNHSEAGAVFWFTLKIAEINQEGQNEEATVSDNTWNILSENEKSLIKKTIIELKRKSVYEITDIENILQKIETDLKNIEEWKFKVLTLAYNCDQEAYDNFLNKI